MGKKNKKIIKSGSNRVSQELQHEFEGGFEISELKKTISSENIDVIFRFNIKDRLDKAYLGLPLDLVNHKGSPLYWATLFFHVKAIYYLLKQGADLFEVVTMKALNSGKLKTAALYEHIVQRLGRKCIEPMLEINNAWAPLILSAYIRYDQFQATDDEIVGWLHKYQPVLSDGGYCFDGAKEKKSLLAFFLIKNFVKSFAWICRQLDDDKWPYYCEKQKLPLAHAAVLVGHSRILAVMAGLPRGRVLCLEKGARGKTPLDLANEKENQGLVDLLTKIARGEDVAEVDASMDNVSVKNCLDLRNFKHLELYFTKYPKKINERIVEINADDKKLNVTPLCYAVMLSMQAEAVWLMEQGACIVRTSKDALSPFYIAIQMNNVEMMRLLIAYDKSVVNEAGGDSDSPLFFAARQLALNAAQYLVCEAAADPFAISTKTKVSNLTENILLLSADKERKRKEMVDWLWSLYQKKEHFDEFYDCVDSPLYTALNANQMTLAMGMIKRLKILGLPLPYMLLNRFLDSADAVKIKLIAPYLINSSIAMPAPNILLQLNSGEVDLVIMWAKIKRVIIEDKRFIASLCFFLFASHFELQKKVVLSMLDLSKPIKIKPQLDLHFVDIFVLQKRIDLVEKALEQGADLTDHICFDAEGQVTPLQYIEKNYDEPEWRALVRLCSEEESDSSESDENTDPLHPKIKVNSKPLADDHSSALSEVVKRWRRAEVRCTVKNSLFQPIKPTWFDGVLGSDGVDIISKSANTYFLIAPGLLTGPYSKNIARYFLGRPAHFSKKCLHKMVLDDELYYKVAGLNKKYKFTHEMVKRGVKDRLVVVKVGADNCCASLFLAVDYAADGFHQAKDVAGLKNKKREVNLSFILGDTIKSISSSDADRSNILSL